LLYDINDPLSVKPKRQLTEKQKKATFLRKAKRKFKNFLEEQYEGRKRAILYTEYIKSLFYNNKLFLLLQSATTGLKSTYICEMIIINQDKRILFDSLINPLKPFEYEEIEYNGIDSAMVKDSPTFTDIYQKLKSILSDKLVFVWNDFHYKTFNFNCAKFNLPKINFIFDDLQWIYTCIDRPFAEEDYDRIHFYSSRRAKEVIFLAYQKMTEIRDSVTFNVFDYFDNRDNIERDLLIKWYKEDYPDDIIFNTPSDQDVTLGDGADQPREGDLMLSPITRSVEYLLHGCGTKSLGGAGDGN
jgi:DNA polymerase III epsilon subunit-like protein